MDNIFRLCKMREEFGRPFDYPFVKNDHCHIEGDGVKTYYVNFSIIKANPLEINGSTKIIEQIQRTL